LSRCPKDTNVPSIVEKELGLCWQLFRDGSGSDGIIELELTLEETRRHPLVLVALGQLYLMAGQGVPELLPSEGPAADTGSWERNRPRLLARARDLLLEAGRARPDDAAVDYLLADVARAGGDHAGADRLAAAGLGKCTGGRSFLMMRQYQELNLYPPELRAAATPDYPESAVIKGVSGQVVLDVLLDPTGLVRQVAVVSTPSADLARAAGEAFRTSEFAPGRVGKYPVWAWLRVATNFSLGSGS
jgi:TonB family protein